MNSEGELQPNRRLLLSGALAQSIFDMAALFAADEPRPVETRKGNMLYRTFGRTGETVSVIGVGGSHIGQTASDDLAIRITRSAIDRGINFMDNSWDYNNGDGLGELKMGKALRDGYRQKVFLMTRVDGRTKDTPQFTWCRSKMPNRPQPVPPIFQPEVAAERIVWVTPKPAGSLRGDPDGDRHRSQQDRTDARRLLSRAQCCGFTANERTRGRRSAGQPFRAFTGGLWRTRSVRRAARPVAATTWLSEHKGTTALAGAAAFGVLAFAFKRRAS
jgi:hypothetical protein